MAPLSLSHHIQLRAQHSQHRQQLARSKLGRPSTLKTRQGFGRHASFGRHIALLQAQLLATRSDGFTEFLKGLHLIYMSINDLNGLIIDANIKIRKQRG
jgi:hypothetical protein